MNSTPQVPFFRAPLGEGEQAAVAAVIESGWLTSGEQVRSFETEFCEFVGAEHAIALNSCTAALHLALLAHNIGDGDEVIVPAMTFAATAEVCLAVGAVPVIADIDPETYCLDPADVRARITDRTRAFMPVHYAGAAADMASLGELAADIDGVIIEDAAHALPTETAKGRIGSLESTACFSFYANKTITTGEGGMLTTPDAEIADLARSLSLHGLSRDAWGRFKPGAKWEYDIAHAGWKYNMTDVAAAMGRVQLSRADSFTERRRHWAARYLEAVADIDGVEPLQNGPIEDSAAHLFVVRVDPASIGRSRNEIIEHLNAHGVGTSVHYKPLHLHSLYRDQFGYSPSDVPVATAEFQRNLSLPLYPDLDDESFEHVIATLRAAVTS